MASIPDYHYHLFFYKRMLVDELEHPVKTRMKTQGTMSLKNTAARAAGRSISILHIVLCVFFLKAYASGGTGAPGVNPYENPENNVTQRYRSTDS